MRKGIYLYGVMLLLVMVIILGFSPSVIERPYYVFNRELLMQNSNASWHLVRGIYELFPTAAGGDIEYPPYFGGLYVDGYGHLVVLLVGDITYDEAYDILNIDRTSAVSFRHVEFTFSTLAYVLRVVMDVLMDSSRRYGMECVYLQQYGSVWLDASANRVSVGVFDLEYIEYFQRNITDHPAVEFILTEPFHDVRTWWNSLLLAVMVILVSSLVLAVGSAIAIKKKFKLLGRACFHAYPYSSNPRHTV